MPEHDDFEERLRRVFRRVAEGSPTTGEDRPHTFGSRGLPVGHDDGAFLDENLSTVSLRPRRRTLVLVAASLLLLAAIGVSVGLVAAGTGSTGSGPHQSSNTEASGARARVISALAATTAAGNWNITYSYTQVPGRSSATTTTVPPALTCPTTIPPSGATGSGCAVLVVPGSSAPNDGSVTVMGSGVIDVNPKAMVTTADPSDFGTVIIRLDSSELWELGSDDGGGLAPGPGVGSTAGESISGFASLVESTLGAREGAVAMLGIASPTGYLVLDEQEITGVTSAGQGTVDGQPVTEYQVAADASQLESDPTATAEELATIRGAIAKLQGEGLSGTGTEVAVDAQGFIIQSITTYQFSDGGSVTVKADFSNFGCAGTVLMPGQVGPTTPPANCVSPDTPSSTTTTTSSTSTSTSNATTTTSSSPTTTSTTVAPTTPTTPTTIGIAPAITTTPSSTGSPTTSTSIAGSSTTTSTGP
jgi:hypothetical protein